MPGSQLQMKSELGRRGGESLVSPAVRWPGLGWLSPARVKSLLCLNQRLLQ